MLYLLLPLFGILLLLLHIKYSQQKWHYYIIVITVTLLIKATDDFIKESLGVEWWVIGIACIFVLLSIFIKRK